MTQHRLTPLLAPRSIVLMGASQRINAAGNDMVLELIEAGFTGSVFPVNPKYDEVEGHPCYSALTEIPQKVDLTVFAIGNASLEQQFEQAIRLETKAAVIFGSTHLENDPSPKLITRLEGMAREAGIPVCGANCLGFYNNDANVRVFPQHLAAKLEPGGVTFISQSGSVLTALLWNNRKLKFNLAVSCGQELVTRVSDYMEYALQQPSTRVICLFLETVRNPEGFVTALKHALDRQIPVVILKTGRTAVSAALAISHSGAIVGDDDAYQAVFERYGVIRVHSLDEMAATALLLSQERKVGPGGLAAILDSGGERELFLDLADDFAVPIAIITPQTQAVLKKHLDPGLEPINPLDAWGTGQNYQEIYEHCFQALMNDPNTAIGVMIADMTSGFWLHESFGRVCRRVAKRTTKPVVMMTNHQGSAGQDLAERMLRAGVPVFDGTEASLAAFRHAFDYQAFNELDFGPLPDAVAPQTVTKWRDRLSHGSSPLDEAESLSLLQDYAIAVPKFKIANDLESVIRAAREIGFPVALKTAQPGIFHKSDVGGVKLALMSSDEVAQAYRDLSDRLGNSVLISSMIAGEVEIALGLVHDAQFGSMVVVASGGILIEILKDRRVALPPFGEARAHRLIDRLKIRPLLDGHRNRPASDIAALAKTLAKFSMLADDLGDLISEADVNPMKVGPDGCIAVDALIVPHKA